MKFALYFLGFLLMWPLVGGWIVLSMWVGDQWGWHSGIGLLFAPIWILGAAVCAAGCLLNSSFGAPPPIIW